MKPRPGLLALFFLFIASPTLAQRFEPGAKYDSPFPIFKFDRGVNCELSTLPTLHCLLSTVCQEDI